MKTLLCLETKNWTTLRCCRW